MLSRKQNLLETISHGNPDRFVNQYEAFQMVYGTPYTTSVPMAVKGGPNVVNQWGGDHFFP